MSAASYELTRETAASVARRSYGRLVALLAARTRDLAGAEDALGEAFAAALVDWPARGVPGNPEAWILTAARRKWIDAIRRRRTVEDSAARLEQIAEEMEAAAPAPSELEDEGLALVFACAHPAIDRGIRAPLILQSIFGIDAAAIGAAFGVSPAAMRQRLVRAKSRIRRAGIRLEVPDRAELAPRLGAVLEALSAAFALGRSARCSGGEQLAAEALRLARLVAALLPGEPDARRLVAAMLRARGDTEELRRPAQA